MVVQHVAQLIQHLDVERLLVHELAVNVDHLPVHVRPSTPACLVAGKHPAHGSWYAARDGAKVQARVQHAMDCRNRAPAGAGRASRHERVVEIAQRELDHAANLLVEVLAV